MRIDPRVSAVEVGAEQVQLGNGPRAVVVDARHRGVRTLLAELTAGRSAADAVPALARRCGMGEADVRRLLDGLAPVLVGRLDGEGSAGGARGRAAEGAPGGATEEPVGGGAEGPLGRAASGVPDAVHVEGLGRTGMAVVDLLASAGVGRLGLTDTGPVRADELGHGLVTADIGRPRAEALAQRLGDRGVTAVPCPPSARRAVGAVAVLVTLGAWDVGRLARTQAAGRTVLPVAVRDEDTLVGPWCAPGTPGCPLCWERWAEQEDPLRSARTAALLAAGAGRETVGRAHRTASAVLATVLRGPVPGVAWRVRDEADGRQSRGADVDEESVAPWPGCACGR